MASSNSEAGQSLAYRGYDKAIRPVDDHLLTQTSRETPGGEYLRRFWHPFMIASNLQDAPVAIRLMGEDLVVFRDKSGRLGLLHKHCLHRGASLEFGIPAEQGIVCCYHGWQFDIDGTILATPAEPAASQIKSRCSQGAYPVREEYGLLFAYLGPIEEMPEFPYFDTCFHPDDNRLAPFQMELPCNWLQVVENAADPIHNAYLHAIVAGEQFSSAFKAAPQLDFPDTPIGFLSMASRFVDGQLFVRAGDMIMPNVGQFPNGANSLGEEGVALRPYITRWVVPVDDVNCFYIGVAHLNEYNGRTMRQDPELYGLNIFPFIGQTGDRPYEERQLEPGDYDAVVGQGAITNRKAENLGQTDRGVGILRRKLARAIGDLQQGRPPAPYERDHRGRVRTYAHETVLNMTGVTALSDPEIRHLGRDSAEAFIRSADGPIDEREREVERQLRARIETPRGN